MDLPPSFTILPPPPPQDPNPNSRTFPPYHHHHHHNPSTAPTTVPTQPPDLHTTLSTLKHLINLSKTTIQSLSNILPTTTTPSAADAIATCPYNSNHRVPPSSLFHHHLRCPSSPVLIDLAFCDSLHYPNSLKAPQPLLNQKNNYFTQTLSTDASTDICLSLDGYHTSLDSNFFYEDCPAVVTFPHEKNKSDCMLTLPAVLSSECADYTGDGYNYKIDTIDGLFSSSYLVKLLPSEYWNVRTEINQWNDYPSVYSHGVLRSIVSCYNSQKEHLTEWIVVNSPSYGAVIDVFMRDHILLLFNLCLKAIGKEATRHLVSISQGDQTGAKFCFECPVMGKVLTWLASQLAILYGEVNGKLLAINMLKQSLQIAASKSLFLYGEIDGSTLPLKGTSENDGKTSEKIHLSQIAAAVAALHERSMFETRIRAIRASRSLPVYQRVQEHEYISKMADEERGKRSNYRPIIEHDGVLWHRGGNQDGNKNKSKEELLAEERDYKRKRMSYRGKKMKRSTTQVTRDIIDEYMEEIKHAYMAGQPPVDPTSKPSAMNDSHEDKKAKISSKSVQKSDVKESVSDVRMKSSKYGDEMKEKSNKKRHQESDITHDREQQDEYKSSRRSQGHSRSREHVRVRKDQKRNEFDDRYDPSKSHGVDEDDR